MPSTHRIGLNMAGALVLAFVAAGTGRAVTSSQPPAGDAASQRAALMNEGQALFGTNCSSCHADPGNDSIGPTLGGNAALTSKENVIRRVLQGVPERGMPPFAPSLTDRQVAAVTTFVRNAWDNAYGVVLEADVAKVREELTKK